MVVLIEKSVFLVAVVFFGWKVGFAVGLMIEKSVFLVVEVVFFGWKVGFVVGLRKEIFIGLWV